jgi:hypothetical protein
MNWPPLGISVPEHLGPRGLSVEGLITRCRALDISLIEVRGDAIETFLGAPVPIVPLDPPPSDGEGLALGLIDLEEEVLRDAYNLAKATFDEQVRAWRASVSLAGLDGLRRRLNEADVGVVSMTWADLGAAADADLHHACRVATTLGARAIVTSFPPADGVGRLARVAQAHQLRIGLDSSGAGSLDEVDASLAAGPFIGTTVDIGDWTADRSTTPIPFLSRHADRVTHVYVRDRRRDHGPSMPFGEGDTPIGEVLAAMRAGGWPFPAIVLPD